MLPGANRSQGSCKHESGHDSVDTVDTSTAAVGVKHPRRSAAAHDCFHHQGVPELTIELAT
jgi:hypothetical protein